MRVSMTAGRTSLAFVVLAGMALYSSFAQTRSDKTIVVAIVDGKLHADPARLMAKDSQMIIEWVQGKPSVPFRIEFERNNPCDPANSRLDQDPAVCVISHPNPGTYRYRMIPKDERPHVAPGRGVVILSRVKSWGAGCT
jgi:hypothetical protein